MVTIERVNKYDDDLLRSVNALLPALSDSARALDKEALQGILSSGSSHLFLAVKEGQAVGMLTLVVFPIPTGIRAWIEDVVVSEAARNQGVGRQLIATASRFAKELGAKSVDLTSRPSREAANALYLKCGFERRETNVYRLGSAADQSG